jgi:hypothetical protein
MKLDNEYQNTGSNSNFIYLFIYLLQIYNLLHSLQ